MAQRGPGADPAVTGCRVSVCVPTRDRADLLRKSLDSILAQAYGPYEVLVCDNWSADGTAELCRELAATSGRLRYVRPAAPVGLYANHNAAFAEARGEYVCFFHDDDLYGPEIVARYAAFLDAHPRVGIVCSDWDKIDAGGRVITPRVNRVPEIMPGHEYIERTMRSGRSTVALSGSMIRREAVPQPPFDESGPLGFTDMVTWCRIAERWDVGHVGERLWSYRQHSAAFSQRRISDSVDDHTKAFTAYVDAYERRHADAGALVARWRTAIRRYRFWALVYELTMHLAPAGTRETASDRAGSPRYVLSDTEARAIVAQLGPLASGPLERATYAVVRATVLRGARPPFTMLARYTDLARRVLRMT